MSDTKNAGTKNARNPQKGQSQGSKSGSQAPKTAAGLPATQKQTDAQPPDPRRYPVWVLLGLLSAALIQKSFGVSEFIGAFLLSAVLLFLIYKDVKRYQPAYFGDFKNLVLLGGMIVGTLAVGRLSEFILMAFLRGQGWQEVAGAAGFAYPVAAGAMLAALLFDFHAAIIFSFALGLLTGLWLGQPAFSFYFFVGSLTAAFSVFRCKRRTAILRAGFYLAGVNILSIMAIYLFAGKFFTFEMSVAIIFSALSALVVVMLVSLLLPALEHIFNMTTDISLLELLDVDHPLMKTLMINAPGTYHHSIVVGNLVESVAESIGVNPLLGRVSAYYHDIGKIKMPEYFIENQTSGINKHERLNPHMSSMILISHVKEGIDLANKYKLPRPVKGIIQQHHGSSLMKYFYQKARERDTDQGTTEDEYRYPGPKPQSRVAALVMMADAVEAASRVLNDPTSARIRALVDKIINHIYLEGQLDECELTFKDIHDIKERFTYILTGMLHRRVDYPGFNFNEDASSPPPPGSAEEAGGGQANGRKGSGGGSGGQSGGLAAAQPPSSSIRTEGPAPDLPVGSSGGSPFEGNDRQPAEKGAAEAGAPQDRRTGRSFGP